MGHANSVKSSWYFFFFCCCPFSLVGLIVWADLGTQNKGGGLSSASVYEQTPMRGSIISMKQLRKYVHNFFFFIIMGVVERSVKGIKPNGGFIIDFGIVFFITMRVIQRLWRSLHLNSLSNFCCFQKLL